MHPHRPEPDVYPERLRQLRSDEKLNLVYFGSFGDQNVDAINWFVGEVWLTGLADRFVLSVYGSVCDGLTTRVPGVRLCGGIANIENVYSDADIAINPVRFGSGLKIKNIEALAFGVPLVTTSVGAEGLEEGEGTFFLCGDSPDDFKRQLSRLVDTETRRSFSEKALAFVDQNLTPEACFGPIKSAIDEGPRDVR
jgi:glycosyltransferase involved in cell wall biosynthesis